MMVLITYEEHVGKDIVSNVSEEIRREKIRFAQAFPSFTEYRHAAAVPIDFTSP